LRSPSKFNDLIAELCGRPVNIEMEKTKNELRIRLRVVLTATPTKGVLKTCKWFLGSEGNSSGLSETSDEVACVMFVWVEPLCQLG